MDAMLLWAFLSSGLDAMLLYYYFCRLSNTPCRWYWNVLYTILSCGFAAFQYLNWVGEFFYVFPSIFLLAFCGILFQKCRFVESIALSSLVFSVYSVITGAVQSLAFGIVSIINISSEMLSMVFVFFQNVLMVLLLIITFRMILKSFSNSIGTIRGPSLLMFLMPVLFVTFVGAFLSDSVYGNTTIFNNSQLVFPNVNSFELLALRLLACGGLVSTLFAYKRLLQSIGREQTIQLLEQQTQNQEIYVKEAKERYAQTLSFRHDIKNHFLVLKQLLTDKNPDAAQDYLERLKEISDTLSFPVQTGNSTVDALLGSKLALATRKGINVDCTVHIPKQSGIKDIDWCIVLANALDNAINANEELCEQDKMICVSGKQKGNVYFLNIENRCCKETRLPKLGIGLSNIEAVINKYNGKMEIEITGDIFKLSTLFVIPQHSERISQQTH